MVLLPDDANGDLVVGQLAGGEPGVEVLVRLHLTDDGRHRADAGGDRSRVALLDRMAESDVESPRVATDLLLGQMPSGGDGSADGRPVGSDVHVQSIAHSCPLTP